MLAPGEVETGPTVFDWLLDDEIGTQYVLPDLSYACPRCRGLHMRFVMTGNWD